MTERKGRRGKQSQGEGVEGYKDALKILKKKKRVVSGAQIQQSDWISGSGNPGYKLRLSLQDGRGTIEGAFVDLYYGVSMYGVPDKFSAALVVSGRRCMAVDFGGTPSGARGHFNKKGEDGKHYQKHVGNPHIHVPMRDTLDDYAEPIEAGSPEEAWEIFCKRAEITDPPKFSPPPVQLGLLE